MQELQNVKRKLVEALAEMGRDGQAMNDPAVHRVCEISKALSNIATFEAMEERSGGNSEDYSGARRGYSRGNDWEHGGNYREQTSREGGHGSSYNGGSYGGSYGREEERRELERRLEQMPREEREQIMRTLSVMR